MKTTAIFILSWAMLAAGIASLRDDDPFWLHWLFAASAVACAVLSLVAVWRVLLRALMRDDGRDEAARSGTTEMF